MLSVSRQVRATPAEAWELIASTATWSSWGPSVSAVEPADAVVSAGMQGRVRLPVGVWVPFEITRCEPPHTWTWSILGLPATRHTVEGSAGGCRISFAVPALAPAYLLVCRVALARVATLLA